MGSSTLTSKMARLLLAVVVLACLLFLASAIPMPFNAQALPGAWHYNGDVARSCFCSAHFRLLLLARKLNLDIACSFICACFRFLFSVLSFIPRKPNLAIAEHVWPGLVKKELTFGGK